MHGDGDLLEQLVFNLVANAVTHNCAGGFAEVSVAPEDGEAALRVTNSGPRVADEEVALLTEPFQRLERRDRRGAGVGLSIVRAVTNAHRGRLELHAREDGGLVAETLLPLAYSRTRDDVSAGSGQSSRSSSSHVL